MPQTITVTIKNGKATVETQGFVGETCKDATRDLERAMGMTTADVPTPEMHNQARVDIRN